MNTPVPTASMPITYRPDLNVLVVRWMYDATPADLQQTYRNLLVEAATTKCQSWLLDARRRFNTNPVLQQWLIREFMPQAYATLGKRIYLAYLLAPVHLRDIDADSAFPPAAFFVDKPYIADRFTEENKAIEWLQAAR